MFICLFESRNIYEDKVSTIYMTINVYKDKNYRIVLNVHTICRIADSVQTV